MPDSDPFDPQLIQLIRACGDELIQYAPAHFKETHCVIGERAENGREVIVCEIGCPQYTTESTTDPSPGMRNIAWKWMKLWKEKGRVFSGFRFRMICTFEEEGRWKTAVSELSK